MSLDRSMLEAAEIPSFDRKRDLGPFTRLYRFHHGRRFHWLKRKTSTIGKSAVSVLELGCNDARSIRYISPAIERYVGFDAGWRSGIRDGCPYGLEAARAEYRDVPHFEFHRSDRYEDVERVQGRFDVAIVLETFEYLRPNELEQYVAILAAKLNDSGCIYSTMPNEKGIPLLLKVLGSKLSHVPRSEYTPRQLLNAVLGRMHKVPRKAFGRKGFDYAALAQIARRHFTRIQLEPLEPSFVPLSLSLNVGLTACKRPAATTAVHT
jgi:SAM-dependent methyltransferase